MSLDSRHRLQGDESHEQGANGRLVSDIFSPSGHRKMRPFSIVSSLVLTALIVLLVSALSGCGGGPDLSGDYAGTVHFSRGWYKGDTYHVQLSVEQKGDNINATSTMTFDAAHSFSDGTDGARQVIRMSGREKKDGSFSLASGDGGALTYEGRQLSDSGDLSGTLGISDGNGTTTGHLEAKEQ